MRKLGSRLRKDKQGFAHSGSFGKRMQDLEVAFGGAVVAGEDLAGAQGELFSDQRVERATDGGGDFLVVTGKQGSFGSEEVTDEGLEIFHMRAEDKGFFSKDGFGWILSAGGEEGFSDNNDI